MIDLNCDMGEGIGNDALIMPYITSANIACGYHAGNEETMISTLLLAKKYNVHAGAHPSFPDRENFGRTEMKTTADEIYDLIIKQVELLRGIAADNEYTLHHVKPHGALYNMAAKNRDLAAAVAKAVKDIDAACILYGLSNSFLISEANAIGLQTASEVFADRTYQDDGSLTPRSHPDALIKNTADAIGQVKMMMQGKVRSLSGKIIPIKADTICIHGDGEHAVEFAKVLRDIIYKATR